jgi:DNA invertase Pin-like site-specific DNA recombinase
MMHDSVDAQHGRLRYVIYARKSTEGEERQALSIESQVRQAREAFPDLYIARIVEERQTAFKPEMRPEFQRLLEEIESGVVDGIIAWHPDRLSRNEIDAAVITYRVRTGVIKDLRFCSYSFSNTPDGIRELQSALSLSQFTSAKLSVDVKRGIQQKLLQGWRPGVVPPGYLNDQVEKTIITDSERFDLVRRMWDLLLSRQYTANRIVQIAADEWGLTTPKRKRIGGNPITTSGVYRIFHNPFYAGFIQHKGKLYKGRHKPMVTVDEFRQADAILSSQPRSRLRRVMRHDFAYRGFIFCAECGAQYTAELKKGIVYYHCTRRKKGIKCSQRQWIREDAIEATLLATMKRYTVPQSLRDPTFRFLDEQAEQEARDGAAIDESRHQQLKALQAKLGVLIDMRLGGLLDDDDFLIRQAAIKMDIAKLRGQIEQANGERIQMERDRRAFTFLTHAREVFRYGTHRKKQAVVRGMAKSLLASEGRLSVTVQDWMVPVEGYDRASVSPIRSNALIRARCQEGGERVKRAPPRSYREVSTGAAANNSDTNEKTAASATELSIWLGRVRQVRTILRTLGPDVYIPRFNELGDVVDGL